MLHRASTRPVNRARPRAFAQAVAMFSTLLK
jgi:hypothetical protein